MKHLMPKSVTLENSTASTMRPTSNAGSWDVARRYQNQVLRCRVSTLDEYHYVSKYDLPEVAVLPGVAGVVPSKLPVEFTDSFNVNNGLLETGGYPFLVFYYQAHVVFMRWIPYYPRYALFYVPSVHECRGLALADGTEERRVGLYSCLLS